MVGPLTALRLSQQSPFHFFQFLAEKVDLTAYPAIGLHFAGYHLRGVKDGRMTAVDGLTNVLKGLLSVAAAQICVDAPWIGVNLFSGLGAQHVRVNLVILTHKPLNLLWRYGPFT